MVLAAGLGTRMKSGQVKVLHSLCGKPMILHLLERVKSLPLGRIVIVLGYQKEKVKEVVRKAFPKAEFVYQEKQLGTGHALAQADKLYTGGEKTLLILNGDTPLISENTLTSFIRNHQSKNATLSLLTVELEEPFGYGRILRNRRGILQKIIEEKDATPIQRKIREVNSGIYLIQSKFAFDGLKRITARNAQKEYYLTDILAIGVQAKERVESLKCVDSEEVMGINSRLDLSRVEKSLRKRIAESWMKEGVTMIDPETTYIDQDVSIGKDTIIYPGTFLLNGSSVGEECILRSHVTISNSEIGKGTTIKEFCVISESRIKEGAIVGPFAHIRPGTLLHQNARIGNFVEIKKSEIGTGSKVNHLSYIGDAILGKRVNVGAGTITCNYDGHQKYQTIIGDDVFIGSDTQLIAPIRVEDGSLIGAGSTIVEDVPRNSLALSRMKQIIKKDWVIRNRNKQNRKKKEK